MTPYWKSDCGRAVVYLGDNLPIMTRMEPDQFHAVVTDPPYGLEFMGEQWDAPWKKSGTIDDVIRRAAELIDPVRAKYLRHNVTYGRSNPKAYQDWLYDRARQVLRTAKPGAHLLSFGGTRMWHRTACAIEDAGFEIRDTIMWLYGSGFPKSHDISKAIDKINGVEREVVGQRPGLEGSGFGDVGHGLKSGMIDVTEPTTDEAKQWDGWGTCLKPAVEPIVVARKTLVGSAAENTLENGCGGLNVDGCRVGTEEMPVTVSDGTMVSNNRAMAGGNTGRIHVGNKTGRWPANVIHDGSEEVLGAFAQFGEVGGGSGGPRFSASEIGYGGGNKGAVTYSFNDSGTAARFFYCAKASDEERSIADSHGHPTVKPLALMQYLVRLVCARGGTVLDPFMGSGSTGCAAVLEGCYFVGIEQDDGYAKIAVDRLKEVLGVHPIVERLRSGRRVVKDTPPPPKRLD